MIDDPAQVIDLLGKLEAHVPIPANPTSSLAQVLRSKGLKVSKQRAFFVPASILHGR